MNKGLLIIATIILGSLGTLLTPAVVSAQYTPPEEVLECNVNKIVVHVGESGDVTATLTDLTGKPISGTLVSFQIVSGDGTLSKTSAVTDANGDAITSIVGGSSGGSVIVRATAGAESCQAVLDVIKDPIRIAEVSPSAPPTGDGGLINAGSDASPLLYIGFFAAVMGLGLAWLILRRSDGSVWRGPKS